MQENRPLEHFLQDCQGLLGPDGVRREPQSCGLYLSEFELQNREQHSIWAAVCPGSTEQVREIMRIASQRGIRLWPIARGQNLGYGAAAPLVGGSVILDLSRMNRILEVDAKAAYCVIEPGVGFIDLFNHLQSNNIPLWTSIPGNPLGSVLGNALERGIGSSPYGDHATRLCGLEVVLADGQTVRTGMGAMTHSKSGHQYQGGFGPSWDGMFIQSNFGIVTRAGLWLMPEPEATLRARVVLPAFGDLGWAIDALTQLRLRHVLEHPVVIGNWLHEAAVYSQRSDWYRGQGTVPEEVIRRIVDRYRLGQWNFSLKLFGYPEVIRAQAQVIKKSLESRIPPITFEIWRRGETLRHSAASLPDTTGLRAANWQGGRGAHLCFSPVLPADGSLALGHYERVLRRFEEFGLDCYSSFVVNARHVTNVNMIIFDRDDSAMLENAQLLFHRLVADAAKEGLAEYRTHIDYMQMVADTFDFNDHALQKLNGRIKDALDPQGIIAPGKNGIWPSRHPR